MERSSVSSSSNFDMHSLNSELPRFRPQFSDDISVESFEGDPLNMGFIADTESVTDPASLHLSEISSIQLARSQAGSDTRTKKLSVSSDVSSVLDKEIEQQEEDSLYQIINTMKRKPSSQIMESESCNPSWQFKKKRVLDSKEIDERVSSQKIELQNQHRRRYPTRQALKLLDDKFQKQMKGMF